jgi:hypothetical protein
MAALRLQRGLDTTDVFTELRKPYRSAANFMFLLDSALLCDVHHTIHTSAAPRALRDEQLSETQRGKPETYITNGKKS